MNKVTFLNPYVDMCAANLWPSLTSPAPGVWPAELTLHLPAALACCLLRQEGVLFVRPFFALDSPRSLSASSGMSAWLVLIHPQLTVVQGSFSPFKGEIASVRVFVFQVDTPLTLSFPGCTCISAQYISHPTDLWTAPANAICFSVPLKSFCTSFQCLLPSPSSWTCLWALNPLILHAWTCFCLLLYGCPQSAFSVKKRFITPFLYTHISGSVKGPVLTPFNACFVNLI